LHNELANGYLIEKQGVVINGKCSTWSHVLSGVLHGLVLGPILFIIYINDIDLCINGCILNFVDDKKLFNCVGTTDDIACLRNVLYKLSYWSEEWLMLFNIDKCKVMYFGHINNRVLYQDRKSVV